MFTYRPNKQLIKTEENSNCRSHVFVSGYWTKESNKYLFQIIGVLLFHGQIIYLIPKYNLTEDKRYRVRV